ncbi:MAG: short-chain dehydrogenase [Alicyclobacillus sp.]|nr:short-chain dehydrogenase [Alicyclobacillus sp.]MCL6515818.1 short-chain dehydrogenase [Alicyclobacillus sp.]
MHTVVVGGTGMLSGVTTWLAEHGHTVSVISRRPGRFSVTSDCHGTFHSITVDYRSSSELRQCVAGAMAQYGPIELAVFWIHSDAPDAFRIIADEISTHAENPWRLFHVRGSSAHLNPDPPPVPPACLYRQVVLGFVLEPDMTSRWLTHQEISDGVIQAIQNDWEHSVVGTLEPWEGRPR